MIRTLLTGAAIFAMSCAQAQSGKLTAQQERMKSCNAQASTNELKGEKRQQFMSGCLKGEKQGEGRELTAQQQNGRVPSEDQQTLCCDATRCANRRHRVGRGRRHAPVQHPGRGPGRRLQPRIFPVPRPRFLSRLTFARLGWQHRRPGRHQMTLNRVQYV